MTSNRNNPYPDLDDESGKPLDPVVPPQPLAGDRGEPTTKAPKRKKPIIIVLVIVLIVGAIAAAGFFGLFLYRKVQGNKAAAAVQVQDDPALASRSSTGPDLGKFQQGIADGIEAQRKADELAEAQRKAALATQGGSQAQPTQQPPLGQYGAPQGKPANYQQPVDKNGKPVLTPAEKAAARRLGGEVMWVDDGNAASSGSKGGSNGQRGQPTGADDGYDDRLADSSGSGGSSNGLGGNGGGSGGSQSNSIGSMLKTENYAMGVVGRRRSLKFLLMHGTSIPCNNIERIVTNYAGKLRCTISRDVYSADGSTLLIGKGSFAEGDRKVTMKQGIAKVFVAWGTVETDGLPVRIDSLAADSLGGAGIDAWIDNHYPERFGGAVALSVIDDVFTSLANSTQKSGSDTNISFDNTSDNASDMASIALENSINIPPTGYVNQATETNILIARDIDFSSVYGVE